jgi:serine/threonine-protein kinase RsbW
MSELAGARNEAPPDRPAFGASYVATAASVPRARAGVAEWLHAAGSEELMAGDIAVALAEACNNAVVHAYRTTGANGNGSRFRVDAERDGDTVLVTVTDSGVGMQPRHDSPGAGLGLPLMATLSDHVEMTAGPDGRGTAVSMRFTAAGAHRRTRAHLVDDVTVL